MHRMKIWATNSAYASGSVGVRPSKTAFESFDANVPAPCTATDPVFVFSHEKDPTSYNLFYVPHMGKRFYNVVSVVYREGGVYEYHCHVNLLLSMVRSWKTHQSNNVPTNVRLTRTNVYSLLGQPNDTECYDAKLYPVERYAQRIQLPYGYRSNGEGSSTQNGTWDKDWLWTCHWQNQDTMFELGYMDSVNGFVMVLCTEATFKTILSNLCTQALSGISDTALAKFYGNPTESIKVCRVMPFKEVDVLRKSDVFTAMTAVNIGYYTISGLTHLYHVPHMNPEATISIESRFSLSAHPQNATITDTIINRPPHMLTYYNIPPYGLIEIDTSDYNWRSSAMYKCAILNQIDCVSGDGTLYEKHMDNDDSTAGTDYAWMNNHKWKQLARTPVYMDVPLMALVQNVASIRSAQLGLAQLDTKRNMPDAQLNRLITSVVSGAWAGIKNSNFNALDSALQPAYNQMQYDAYQRQLLKQGYEQSENTTTLGIFGHSKGVSALASGLSYATRNAAEKEPPASYYKQLNLGAGIKNAVNTAAPYVDNALAAMDATYNFTHETNAYKTQISDATHYPQISITGNTSGTVAFKNSLTGAPYILYTYELYAPNFDIGTIGHECCKPVTHIMSIASGANPAPVNVCDVVSSNVFIRGADEGQLTDPEKTELRAILTTGFVFSDNNDEWTVS